MKSVEDTKTIDETRQGEAIILNDNDGVSGKMLYLESYGCQMNFADSEVVLSILKNNHYQKCENAIESDLILINTCSIREKAEQNIRKKFNCL